MRALTDGPWAVGSRPVCGASAAAQPQQSVTAGELIVEPPTLISLGFEWHIEGDADRDAAVAVAYRRAGERDVARQPAAAARAERAHVLRRDALLHGAEHVRGQRVRARRGHRVRGALHADGPRRRRRRGAARRQRAHARRAAAVRRRQRRITSIRSATRGRSKSPRSRACSPRTTRTRSAATGAARRRRACSPATRSSCTPASTRTSTASATATRSARSTAPAAATPWDGTFYLTQDGTAERPIAIKAAGDGEVVFDGDGNNVLFNVMGADHTYFEGITFRNTNLAIEAGPEEHRGRRRPDRQALDVRPSRRGDPQRLVGLEEFLHRRQRHERPQRPDLSHRLVQHLAVERRSTASSRSSA